MKNKITFILMILLTFIAVASLGYSFKAMAYLYKGRKVETYNKDVSSTTAVAIVDGTNSDVYDLIFHTASNDYDVRIGSHTGINQTDGFLIKRGLYISPDGLFTGTIYAVAIGSGTILDVLYFK